MAVQTPSPQPSGDFERQEASERRETSAAASVSPGAEAMGQDAIDAQLEENDIQQLREQLRKELNLQFPKINRKEKEQYLDRVETELRDAFEKVCRGQGCWHRIQGMIPSLFGIGGRFMIYARYTIRNKNGKKITTDHWIQLTGFRPKTSDGHRKSEVQHERKPEETESFQAFVQNRLAEIRFPDLYGHLAALSQMSENFPAHYVRRYLQEMERIAAEFARAGNDPERLKGIAEEGQNRLREIGGSLEEEIPAALMRDRGMSMEELHAELDNPNTPLGGLSQAARDFSTHLEKVSPPPPPSGFEKIKEIKDMMEGEGPPA